MHATASGLICWLQLVLTHLECISCTLCQTGQARCCASTMPHGPCDITDVPACIAQRVAYSSHEALAQRGRASKLSLSSRTNRPHTVRHQQLHTSTFAASAAGQHSVSPAEQHSFTISSRASPGEQHSVTLRLSRQALAVCVAALADTLRLERQVACKGPIVCSAAQTHICCVRRWSQHSCALDALACDTEPPCACRGGVRCKRMQRRYPPLLADSAGC